MFNRERLYLYFYDNEVVNYANHQLNKFQIAHLYSKKALVMVWTQDYWIEVMTSHHNLCIHKSSKQRKIIRLQRYLEWWKL